MIGYTRVHVPDAAADRRRSAIFSSGPPSGANWAFRRPLYAYAETAHAFVWDSIVNDGGVDERPIAVRGRGPRLGRKGHLFVGNNRALSSVAPSATVGRLTENWSAFHSGNAHFSRLSEWLFRPAIHARCPEHAHLEIPRSRQGYPNVNGRCGPTKNISRLPMVE